MQKLSQENAIIRKNKNLARSFFGFLFRNWVIILMLAMFASQVYLVFRLNKINKSFAEIQKNNSESHSGDMDAEQIKAMVSSMYSRLGTMQGDLNYLKSRR